MIRQVSKMRFLKSGVQTVNYLEVHITCFCDFLDIPQKSGGSWFLVLGYFIWSWPGIRYKARRDLLSVINHGLKRCVLSEEVCGALTLLYDCSERC